jgi:N-dimethylarginine dimethylaminohydrolase
MLRVLINPTTFCLTSMQKGQNPYIDVHHKINRQSVIKHHRALEHTLQNTIVYTIDKPLHILPDIVFIANGGLSLPRLHKKTILLPNMKYKQRQEELPYLIEIYKNLRLNIIPYPGKEPFEGQAELKWFHGGTKAVCGYGHRSTKKTFQELDQFFKKVYGEHHLVAPELLILPIASYDYYHLDGAILDFDDSKCIVHKRAFSEASIARLKKFLGSENVFVIDVKDTFCLNAIVDGSKLITHKLTADVKQKLEQITQRSIKMIDTHEFEQSGGSVRCMALDIY